MNLFPRVLQLPQRWNSFVGKGIGFQLVNLGKALRISQPLFVGGETEVMVLISVKCFERCG